MHELLKYIQIVISLATKSEGGTFQYMGAEGVAYEELFHIFERCFNGCFKNKTLGPGLRSQENQWKRHEMAERAMAFQISDGLHYL